MGDDNEVLAEEDADVARDEGAAAAAANDGRTATGSVAEAPDTAFAKLAGAPEETDIARLEPVAEVTMACSAMAIC